MAELEHRDGDQGDVEFRRDGSAALGRGQIRPFRKRRLRRACLATAAFVVSILCVGLIGGGLFFARLSQGPIAVDIAPRIMAALNQRVGHGYAFDLGGTFVEATDHGPALMIDRLSVADGSNRPVVTAPKAAISIDPLALFVGQISPKRLEIQDIDLRLLILPDGQVAISAGTDGGTAFPLASAFSDGSRAAHGASAPPSEPPDAAPPGPANAAVRALSAVMRSLVDATTAPDGALGALDSVKLTGRLVLDDRTHDTRTVFQNTELHFEKAPNGSAILSVAADGPAGRWSLVAHASRSPDDSKTLTVEVRDLSLDEITLAGGLRSVGFDFDLPVSASVAMRLGANGAVEEAKGRFSLGAGYFKLDDPDFEPLLIDSATGGFHLDPVANVVLIDATELRAGESDFVMTGRIGLPRAAGEAWTINTQASGIFGAERPGEKPIKIAHSGMAFRVLPNERRFVIDKIDVSGPDVTFETSGDLQFGNDGARLKDTSSIRHMPAQAVARLWPSFIAAPVRAWFLANLRGGTIDSGTAKVNLTDKDLATMRAQRSVPDDHVHVDYAVSDMALIVMPGVPALTGIDGTGTVTGDTSQFTVTHGDMEVSPGRKLTLVDGTFNVPSTDPKPTPAVINAHITGNIDAVADLISREALKAYANVPIDSSAVKGQIDAHLGIAMRLGDNVPPDEAKITVNATAENFVAERLIGKESLVDTSLQLVADRNGLRAKGDGRMYGAPASVELKKPSGGGPSEAVINLTLDDAARAKAGVTLGKSLTGVVTARITGSLTPGEKNKAAVDLDFTKATMDGPMPGLTKPAGKPGRATFTVIQRDTGSSLDNIVYDGGGVSVRGSAELDSSGGFASAKLSQLRFSAGDDLKLEATQSSDALKIVARGANVDARPFLRWLGASGPGNGTPAAGAPDNAASPKNVDMELHANVLTGQNSQAVAGADVRMSRRAGQIKSLQITGRFGRQPMSVTTTQLDGAPLFVVKSGDAGSSLAFMDIYKRMVGGRLDANVSFAQGRLDGYATIHDFTLREDPAIKKLATEGLAAQGRSDNLKIDVSSVPFTKLEAYFSKSGNRVNIRDGALYGPEAGATVDGTVDFARDEVNLTGTFVPLFGVNNLFSQIPLFGPILGGGAHEGLFGINYRITGSAGAPVLNINPLSAMAPGFLRKIFGALDGATQGPGQAQVEPRDRASGPVAPAQPLPLIEPE